jgi:hypothetical protein
MALILSITGWILEMERPRRMRAAGFAAASSRAAWAPRDLADDPVMRTNF